MSDITAEDLELFHYGVKGMKWGVRRKVDSDGLVVGPEPGKKTPSARRQRYDTIRNAEMRSFETVAKNGKTVKATEEPSGKISAFLSSLSKTGVEDSKNAPSFKIEADGKQVGEASFNKKSDDEINLVWLGVKPSERGNGYASAVFDAAVQFGRAEGVSKLTLEVPGFAPDARHIYEKQGFKVSKEPTAREIKNDTVWGGLTHMELDLTKEQIKHSALSEDQELELALSQTFTKLTKEQEAMVFGEDGEGEMNHYGKSSEDLELFHYGVKGMKWGVRRPEGPGGRVVKKGIRQRIRERDEKIEDARGKQVDGWRKEVSATSKSIKTKAALARDLKNPEKRANAKTASEARRKATAERKELDQVANKKTSKELAVKGATYALPLVLSIGYVAAGTAGTRRNAKIGEKFKTDLFADTRGLPAPGTIALQFIDGKWQ